MRLAARTARRAEASSCGEPEDARSTGSVNVPSGRTVNIYSATPMSPVSPPSRRPGVHGLVDVVEVAQEGLPLAVGGASALSMSRGLAAAMPMPFSRLVATGRGRHVHLDNGGEGRLGLGGLGAISSAKCANRDTAIPAARAFLFRHGRPGSSGWAVAMSSFSPPCIRTSSTMKTSASTGASGAALSTSCPGRAGSPARGFAASRGCRCGPRVCPRTGTSRP